MLKDIKNMLTMIWFRLTKKRIRKDLLNNLIEENTKEDIVIILIKSTIKKNKRKITSTRNPILFQIKMIKICL